MAKKLKYKGLSDSSELKRSTPITGKKYKENAEFLNSKDFRNNYKRIHLGNGYVKIVKKNLNSDIV